MSEPSTNLGHALPSGTVTFLFTDIEGSTQLAQQHPQAMPGALARHHAIVQDAIATHNGHVFRIVGDEFNAAFATASDALAAALAAQRALHKQSWGETGQIRVRMGLHTGPAVPRGGNYDGYLTLSHTKRLMSIAYGGQILLSQATEALLRGQLPSDVSLRDMGERRLKDFDRRERIYQAVAPDLPAEFPPLKTLDAFPNNLPSQLTSFIGREREIAEVKRLLGTTRLLTLTGVGGTGKTRLSLQVASDVLENYADGVWFVELAPLADPALVPHGLATALGVREQAGRTLMATLTDDLRVKQALLILDNCEHLIGACAQLADALLRECPQLKIIASSREALGIAGEVVWHVPSLTLPDVPECSTVEQALQFEAVRLFVERAAAQTQFALTEQNANAVTQICRRLDGIPLAIELAAARVKSLSVEQIAARLDDRFRLLTGGSRTALPRQQTLRALIDWSHSLLAEPECTLLRRLSVFAGGWTLEAAEAICSDEADKSGGIAPSDVLDLLDSLVNKSLVIAEPHEHSTRYHLLETIRQYARDKLLESGEAERVREQHLAYFVRLGYEAGRKIQTNDDAQWIRRVEQEFDNIRTAIEWSFSRDGLGALHVLGTLTFFGIGRGHLTEARQWCEQVLAQTERATAAEVRALRAQVYIRLATLCVAQGDIDNARRARDEALRLYGELGNPPQKALALAIALLVAGFTGETEAAAAYFDEGLALTRAASDRYTEMMLYATAMRSAANRHDYAAAQAFAEQSITMARELGSQYGLAQALMASGMAATSQGNYTLARARLEESQQRWEPLGYPHFVNVTRSELANVARLTGEFARATQLYREVIPIWHREGHRAGIARCFECLAFIAGAGGNSARSARLLGAAATLRESAHAQMTLEEQEEYAEQVRQIRAKADETDFNAAWEAGRALTLEQAIELALSDEYPTNQPTTNQPKGET